MATFKVTISIIEDDGDEAHVEFRALPNHDADDDTFRLGHLIGHAVRGVSGHLIGEVKEVVEGVCEILELDLTLRPDGGNMTRS